MIVVERMPVPVYELKCEECKSKLRYLASEVSVSHITCPVCGHSNWAQTTIPDDYIDKSDEMEGTEK